MKITQSELRKIIKEELQKSLKLDEASGSNRTIIKPTGSQAPFGLGSNALRAIAKRYLTNLQDPGPVGESNTMSSIISGIVDVTGADPSVVQNNWGSLTADQLKQMDKYISQYSKGSPEQISSFKTAQANTPDAQLKRQQRAKSTVGQTRQTSLGQGDNFMNLAENVDNQELQQKFQAFLKTPEGKKAQQLAMKAKQKLNKPTGAVKESLGDIDASLTATGVFLGPFLAYLAQQGMGVSPNLEDNVIGFLAGVAGGAALGAGLDYLRRDKKDTKSEVPSAGSARWETDPRARRY